MVASIDMVIGQVDFMKQRTESLNRTFGDFQ